MPGVTMRSIWLTIFLALSAPAIALAQNAPPKLAPQPVTEDYFGQVVVDPFRFVENLAPDTLAWMRAQAAFTRDTLDSIRPRAALLERMQRMAGAFGFVGAPEYAGGRLFYLERPPGADQSVLTVRDPDGGRRVLVDTPKLIAERGFPLAIDGFEPSRDGRFVALRMSEKGSENSILTIIDALSGRTIAGPIRMGPFTATSWDEDGKSLFFTRLPDPAVTAEVDRYKNMEVLYWRFGSEPKVVVSARESLGLRLKPEQILSVFTPRGTDRALLIVSDGVANEFEAWEARRADVAQGRAKWRQVVSLDDAVTGIFGSPEGVAFLTHKDAPGYKVTSATWDGTAAGARTILPEQPGIFFESMRGGSDGLYVAGREKLSGAVWRVAKDGKYERLRLPKVANIAGLEAESDRDGALITLSGPATPDTTYAYRRETGFRDLKLERGPATFDSSRYRVEELDAVAGDGTRIPLLILTTAGRRAPLPFILDAYGAYGVVQTPIFYPTIMAAVDAGVGHAQCGVRGGGEFGEAWRLAGKGANKPNGWRDAIACAKALIAGGYTTPRLLAIRGGSMGGIVVGRAATERPDLFAAAISAVGVSNPLRNETTAAGVGNINEIGSVTTKQGFRDLFVMDTYQAIRDGVKLPPFLVTTGLADPRVPPWQPAKLVARLQAAGDTAFLRVDEEAGHGHGSTVSARMREQADIVSFVLWKTGAAAWAPTK